MRTRQRQKCVKSWEKFSHLRTRHRRTDDEVTQRVTNETVTVTQATMSPSYHSNNGGLIESHTWSIEPRLFQWPWRTPYPDFKVRPFFDIEYLQNGCRYGHSYYGRLTGTRMQSIKWCHFQWPWMNPNHVFKVRPFFDTEYLQKRCRYGHSYYGRRIYPVYTCIALNPLSNSVTFTVIVPDVYTGEAKMCKKCAKMANF